ncbi:phytochrome E-like [Dorcoceras hygrometricum]|uniref:Phytochrome E-like n=1 Tax=Dorcoceras hygrometricum TaxID=472368 RepID=A0A2Z7BJW6_9LAMI|nr:phytochrome E-like [Dorcoceras hygrometricum]
MTLRRLRLHSQLATVESIDDLRAFILQRIDDSNSAILSKLHTLEKGLRDSLHDQDDNGRKLINNVCQDAQTISDVQKIHLNDVKKIVLAQGVTAGADSLEIRKAINAVDAKILLLDGQVATTFRIPSKISADLLGLSTQIGDLVDYIRIDDAKKREGSSSRRPLPTPVHHSEGTGDVRLTEPAQGDIDNANRAILERMRNEDSLRAEIERDRARRERRLSRSGAYKRRIGF